MIYLSYNQPTSLKSCRQTLRNECSISYTTIILNVNKVIRQNMSKVFLLCKKTVDFYSTVTDLARFLGWSISSPRSFAISYDNSWKAGEIINGSVNVVWFGTTILLL